MKNAVEISSDYISIRYTDLKKSGINIVLTELCTVWSRHVHCCVDRRAEKEENAVIVAVHYVDNPRSPLIIYKTCYANAIRHKMSHGAKDMITRERVVFN